MTRSIEDISRRRYLAGFGGLAMLSLAPQVTYAGEILGYIGSWSGVLAGRLHVQLDILSSTEASMTYIEQGASKTLATSVVLTGDKISFVFANGTSYTGQLDGKDALKGMLNSQNRLFPLDFKRGKYTGLIVHFESQPLTLDIMKTIRQTAKITGIGCAFAEKTGSPTVWVDGFRSAQSAIPVAPEDEWHLGSITKSMTATLVARMIEADRHLSLDTTVGDVLGKAVPEMQPGYRSVTFRHLLAHRSGLPASLDAAVRNAFPRPGEADTPADPRSDRLRWAAIALQSPQQAKAGMKMIYSNSGYIIIGAMLEQVFARPWEDLISEQVFEPLGLTSAGFFAPGSPGKLDQPLGHSFDPADPDNLTPVPLGTKDHHTDNPVAMAPSGGVHINLGALITYLRAHLNCPPAYLSPASWRTLHTPLYGGDYAMGWFVNKDGVLSHDGTNTLWYAMVKIDPKRGLVSAATANDDRQTTEYAVHTLVDDALLAT